MTATPACVLRVTPFQVQARFFVTLLVQIMKQRRVRARAQLTGEPVDPLEDGQDIRLGIGRSHGSNHLVQFPEADEDFAFGFTHLRIIPAGRNIATPLCAGMLARMRIVVLDGHTLNPGDLSWDELREAGEVIVHPRSAPAEVVPRLAEADAALTNKVPLGREIIAQLPKLRYIGVTATGYNIVDVNAAKERGIVVTNVPAYGTSSVAQATFALLLELTNRAGHHAQTVREGRWSQSPDFCYWDWPLVELAGLTLGIVGYGRIGKQVAAIGRAFGMTVVATQNTPRPTGDETRVVELETLLKESDVVSLHCPLTPQTKHLINRDRIAFMKPSAFLLNTSRGPLIVDADLAEALHAGHLAGAGLDVLSVEPPPPDNPLFHAPNCFITPHQAWATRAARQRLMNVTIENIRAYSRGQPVNVVS